MSRRRDQLAAALRRAVQEVLARGLSDPRIAGLVTVTAVTLDEDLRHAVVHVSVYPADKQDLTLHGLRAAAAHVRHQVGEAVRVRQMPELSFRLDPSLKKQAAVLDAIARAAAPRPHDPADPWHAPPAHLPSTPPREQEDAHP